MNAYLDTAPVIFLAKNVALREPAVRAFLARDEVRPRMSVLTRMKCRAQPLREGNTALLEGYEAFFASVSGGLLSLEARVFEKATDLRARHNFRTADALHLATAIVGEWVCS